MAVLITGLDIARIVNSYEESFKFRFHEVKYSIVKKDLPPLNIYGEPAEGYPRSVSTYYTGVGTVPAYIKLNPEKQILIKYGIDKPRDILIVFCKTLMDASGISPKIGDRIEFKDQEYHITSLQPESFIGNTQYFLDYGCTGDKVREEQID